MSLGHGAITDQRRQRRDGPRHAPGHPDHWCRRRDPPRVVTTAELEEQADIGRFGFEPGWLERVTAVTERRWAEPDPTPSDLASAAARTALADAGREPGEIDTVIFTGITKDYRGPAAANVVADAVRPQEHSATSEGR
jgi:3-oxoacyl-[acyl-carrier-protein] synthase III